MSTLLRRLPLSRLLLLCGVALCVGVGATALALAMSSGPMPPPKPLAQAVHDALAAPPVDGVSARIQLTDRLVEGASLATSGGGEAGQLASSPLLTGASGRLWAGSDGRVRLELQSERGDTQILCDGRTLSLYDASTNTLYRYTPPQHASSPTDSSRRSAPTVREVEEGIERLRKHANVSEATPTDVAGQPAYTVRISPRENGALIGGAELSWDAVHGVPLRAAVYSVDSSSPVIELTATEISYGPIDSGTLDFTPPTDAKIQEVKPPAGRSPADATSAGGSGRAASGESATGGGGPASGGPASGGSATGGESATGGDGRHPRVTLHGSGLTAIALVEEPVKAGSQEGSALEGLRKVDVNGARASELPTELGTLLSFERSGVRYLLAGSLTPSAIEAFARSL